MGKHNQFDITTMLDTGVSIIQMFVSDNGNFSSHQTCLIVQKLHNGNCTFEAVKRLKTCIHKEM